MSVKLIGQVMLTCKQGLKSPQQILWNRCTSYTKPNLISNSARQESFNYPSFSKLRVLCIDSHLQRGAEACSKDLLESARRLQRTRPSQNVHDVLRIYFASLSTRPLTCKEGFKPLDQVFWNRRSSCTHRQETEFSRPIVRQSRHQRF